MVRMIPIYNTNHFALVDEEDYEGLFRFNWLLECAGYARRIGDGNRYILMHREIMQPPDDMVVDHRNGIRLDNRRVNLRVCTLAENGQNQHRPGREDMPFQARTVTLQISSDEAAALDELTRCVGFTRATETARYGLRKLATEFGIAWPKRRSGGRGKPKTG